MKSDCPSEHPHLDVLKRYPQGGYLLTASLATGRLAGTSALRFPSRGA